VQNPALCAGKKQLSAPRTSIIRVDSAWQLLKLAGHFRIPTMSRTFLAILALTATLFGAGCRRSYSNFVILQADQTVLGTSAYPVAIDPSRVGTYPADTKSGAGYFYDDVLEYRVWLHPERGAPPRNGTSDYCMVFAQYERAEAFSRSSAGAEKPLVLVRQIESINEPEPHHYVPVKEERITEWQVKWLATSKRTPTSIDEIMKHPRPQQEADDDDGDR
jgi:hypothetical protein